MLIMSILLCIAVFFAVYFGWLHHKANRFQYHILKRTSITTLDEICYDISQQMTACEHLSVLHPKEAIDCMKERDALYDTYKEVSKEAWDRINRGKATIENLRAI